MLTGMTSLASLTHAADAAAPAFNHDFYTTAGLLIPVLFLAINVQTVFQSLRIPAPERRDRAPSVGAVAVVTSIVFYATTAGIAGEIAAIIALNDQTAGPVIHYLVLVTMILLTVAAGASPFFGAFSLSVRLGRG
jgi:hypothetical protein